MNGIASELQTEEELASTEVALLSIIEVRSKGANHQSVLLSFLQPLESRCDGELESGVKLLLEP